jgi:dihydroorotate dehydrogenase
VRSILFLWSAEKAHYLAMDTLKFVLKIPLLRKLVKGKSPSGSTTIAGVTFKGKLGIAAGFDKNARYINELAHLGFGFVEIGTVTPVPQEGNPKPRLFRLKKDEAIINRMGFNNDGMDKIAKRLEKYMDRDIVIGGNLGKNKVTPNENAPDDYEKCFEKLYYLVDYFVVNVSSPNTPGLRDLQDKDSLGQIFDRLFAKREELYDGVRKPIFLKIAPDLTNDQLDDITELVNSKGIEGLIATNTTISREGLKTDKSIVDEIGAGGLSGKPVKEMSTHVVKYLRNKLPNTPIVGVGGIHSVSDAKEKIAAGADLIQVYSGFIYEGLSLVNGINSEC